MRRLLFIVFVLVGGLASLRIAHAAPVVWLIAEHNANVGLVTVDVADGTLNVIGDLNIFMGDIAFDASGTLYGSDGGSLYEISTIDGTPTQLFNFSGGNSLAFGSNGLLYGNGNNDLVTIDPLTGVETTIGPIGFNGAGDLAFHNGKLYMTTLTDLIEINPTTGAGTLIGALEFGFEIAAFGLVSADGALYGVSVTSILEIDPLTGHGADVLDYGGQGVGFGGGMAFQNTAVPIPGALVLMLSGILGLLGVSKQHDT